MSYKLVVKDAFWQILGKIVSAIVGFFVVKLITPYLGPLRYGDYTTTLNYFVLWTAFADFGLYVISLKDLGKLSHDTKEDTQKLSYRYSEYVWSRFFMIGIVYIVAMIVAYLLPSYTSNVYLLWGLPLGMVYSATALGGSMFRLPLQLYWDMKHVSIALFLARMAQLILLILIIYVFAPGSTFSVENLPLAVFLAVLGSVVVSALTETVYVYFIGKRHLTLQRVPFLDFWKQFVSEKRKYGLSQFLSGLYIPLMLIFLSIFYPTIQNYGYVGQRGLGLSLIGMLWIIPSSLGNSMLHKVAAYEVDKQRESFGSFFLLVLWIGLLFIANFLVFSQPVIQFISGEKYISGLSMGVYDTLGYVFSHLSSLDQNLLRTDFLLPLFGLILLLSFIKNVYNYLFVGTHNHNLLFRVNLIAVIIGFVAGAFLVYHMELLGAVLGQILFGIAFLVVFAIVSHKYGITPKVSLFESGKVLLFFLIVFFLGYFVNVGPHDFWLFIAYAAIANILILGIWYPWLKRVAKKLV